MHAHEDHHAPPEPTRWSSLVFAVKSRCHQVLRFGRDLRQPMPLHARGQTLAESLVCAEWCSDLWRDGSSPRERLLQLGKVQNLRVAAKLLNGIEIPAGATWSFWRQLGRTTKGKGYAVGRELREGCLIPQTGGGLCQLSGAIYNAALEAGLEIVERHAHSLSSVGSLASIGRDATVFWNYVDLRLRAPVAWRMEVSLTRDQLQVRIRCVEKPPPIHRDSGVIPAPSSPPNACATCGLTSCFRSSPLDGGAVQVDQTAVLADDYRPEWQAVLANPLLGRSCLMIPLDGRRWRKPNYAWDTAAHATVKTFPWLALRRAWKVRHLRNEGAQRQRELLAWDQRLAKAFGSRLKAEHSHVIVAQSLLPHLWREGLLGGRTFDVLMSRFPLGELHRRLDHAASLHVESKTCADFRADEELVTAEAQALAAARRWITPHREIAALAGDKAEIVAWSLPQAAARRDNGGTRLRVAFPASTLCRKGAYELREALRGQDVELILLGGVLEGADFWEGVNLVVPESNWLSEADVVVLPAFVEHYPRALLRAVASGVPVIATAACGIEGLPGVTTIAAGDVVALRSALNEMGGERDSSARERPYVSIQQAPAA
jgi:hypothetical protein